MKKYFKYNPSPYPLPQGAKRKQEKKRPPKNRALGAGGDMGAKSFNYTADGTGTGDAKDF